MHDETGSRLFPNIHTMHIILNNHLNCLPRFLYLFYSTSSIPFMVSFLLLHIPSLKDKSGYIFLGCFIFFNGSLNKRAGYYKCKRSCDLDNAVFYMFYKYVERIHIIWYVVSVSVYLLIHAIFSKIKLLKSNSIDMYMSPYRC